MLIRKMYIGGILEMKKFLIHKTPFTVLIFTIIWPDKTVKEIDTILLLKFKNFC